MSIERLNASVNLDAGHRFYVLHGSGVNDVFLAQDYTQLQIEEALHEWLLALGFKRIIFYLPRRGVHFRDASSLRLPRSTQEASPQTDPGTSSGLLMPGPLGSRATGQRSTLRKRASQSSSNQPIEGGLTGVNAVRLLHHLMKEEEPRTAIVVRQMETSLRHFKKPDLLAKVFGEWAALPPLKL